MASTTDRQGHGYEQLLGIQAGHLAVWRQRVVARVMEEVEQYLEATNTQAESPEDRHRVYRGADLTQIIYDWPELLPCYPPMPAPPAEGSEYV